MTGPLPTGVGPDEADVATMSLLDYVLVMWRRRLVVLVVLGAVLGGTYLTTSLMPRSYVADAQVYVSVGTQSGARNLSNGFAYAQGLARSYARVATLPVVLGPVADQLGSRSGIEELQRAVVVRAPADTVLIDIEATDSDRKHAADVANAVADRLQVVIDELSPTRGGGRPPFTLATVSPAAVPTFASSPRKDLSMTVAAVVGLLAAVVAAAVVDDRRGLGGLRRLRAVTSVPLLGTSVRRRRVWWSDRRRAGETTRLRLAFDRLRATRHPKVVALTSSVGGRRFARSLVELGASLRWAGMRVLVVDADLRRRAVTRLAHLDDRAGLADVLSGRAVWRECVATGVEPGVSVLPVGRSAADDGRMLLETLAKTWLFAELRASFDLVLVATPPVQDSADGLTLAPLTEGFIVIADERLTSRATLRAELDAIRLGGSPVLGVVLAG